MTSENNAYEAWKRKESLNRDAEKRIVERYVRNPLDKTQNFRLKDEEYLEDELLQAHRDFKRDVKGSDLEMDGWEDFLV